MIAGGLVVGDAENGVAVILIGLLQLGGGQLTVGNGAVAMQVCLVLGLILLDVSNHSVPLFAKKLDKAILSQKFPVCKAKSIFYGIARNFSSYCRVTTSRRSTAFTRFDHGTR
jgi:hypothetical protein